MPPYKVHDVQTRHRAIELLEQGFGSWAIATQMNLPRNTVVQWIQRYRRQGNEGLEPVTATTTYAFETRVAAVEAFLGGQVKPDVLRDFEIRSYSALDKWIKSNRLHGPAGLQPKRRGRPPRLTPAAVEETLEQRVHRLEMENAALKKLQALAARKQPRESS